MVYDRKYGRTYYEKNKPRIQDYNRRYVAANPVRTKAGQARWRKENYIRVKLHAARTRSQKNGWAFDLEEKDVVIPSVCPVLGIPLSSSGEKKNHPSLDRINNAKGYVKGNVAVISHRANLLKSDATIPELRAILAYMEAHELSA